MRWPVKVRLDMRRGDHLTPELYRTGERLCDGVLAEALRKSRRWFHVPLRSFPVSSRVVELCIACILARSVQGAVPGRGYRT